MANGVGSRWGHYLGIPKHLLRVGDESLLQRLVRQLRTFDPTGEVIISSSDTRYDVPGSRRHAPQTNKIELDRFAPELVTSNACFLYGDTFYQDSLIKEIVETHVSEMLFWGDKQSIVSIRVKNEEVFKNHLERIRYLYINGKISKCVGWQVYRSYCDVPLEEHQFAHSFVFIKGRASGFNTPEEFHFFLKSRHKSLE